MINKKIHSLISNYRCLVKGVLLLLLLAFIFAGCAAENEPAGAVEEPKRLIADDLGRQVELPARVERAVSLAPNLTEIAFAVGAGDRLAGRTSFCNYPPEAEKVRSVGDTLSPNVENIIALKPDVVLVSTASQLESFTKTLETQNIAVFVTDPKSLEDIYQSIDKIGEIFGEQSRAGKLIADLRGRVATVEEKTGNAEKVKVFLQIDRSLYTIGKDSFLTDLIERAGGASVTKTVETAYPKISRETALALQPEAIILSESADNDQPNEVFRNSPAVENGRVYRIDADIISRPAPRVVEALEQMARSLHPENFK